MRQVMQLAVIVNLETAFLLEGQDRLTDSSKCYDLDDVSCEGGSSSPS